MSWSLDRNSSHPCRTATRWTVTTHYAIQLSGTDRVRSGSARPDLLVGSRVTSHPGMCLPATWKISRKNDLFRASYTGWKYAPTPRVMIRTKDHSCCRGLCMPTYAACGFQSATLTRFYTYPFHQPSTPDIFTLIYCLL